MDTRLDRVRKLLSRRNLDALLVSSTANITYLTNFSNFSKDEREALLLITEKQRYLFTDGRYIKAVRKQVEGFDVIEVSSTNPLSKLVRATMRKESMKRLGFEKGDVRVEEYERFGISEIGVEQTIVEKMRMVKDEGEIEAIERARRLGDETFDHILKKIKSGISERELAFEIELFIKKKGADLSFPPIVAFGENSAIPHHKTSGQRLTTNDIVLLDFGVKVDNYCSDMTRTVFFGKASAKQRKMYRTVLEAQRRAIEYLTSKILDNKSSIVNRTHVYAKDVDKIARSFITAQGYPTIPHSLGHGIGLEVHELPRLSPRSKDKLVPGMVFSIEPGIYEPGFGGVRIEDLVILEASGPRLLTNAPNELLEL